MRKLLILFCLFFLAGVVVAQEETEQLAPFRSVVGNLPSGGIESWTFNAVNGEVVSLVAEATSEIDPILTVLSETGAVLVTQDDYDYPNTRNAIIQSLTIPFTGTYTVQVSAYGNTSGSYTLTRLRGFAQGADLNGFNAGETWTTTSDDLTLTVGDGLLGLGLTGIGLEAGAINEGARRLSDYYAQVTVEIEDSRGGWQVHLRHHQQSDDEYYQFSINDQGFWRYSLHAGEEETILRDWISHPAIVPGTATFDIGVLANGVGYEVFYNGNLLGSFSDDTYDGGVIGLGLGTGQAIDAELQVRFENLRITVPAETANGDDLLPGRLIIGDPTEMARALERRRVIPTGGDLMLNVPESSTQSNDLGVSRLPLGRGVTFENFVISTEITINAASDGTNGCGIFFRGTDDTSYTLAFVDQVRGLGMAQREGGEFTPGIFDERIGIGEAEHHLLAVVNGEIAHYYVDGIYAGTLEIPAAAGTVGNAVVNYDPNTTICNFQNTWVWSWDDPAT